VLRSSNSSGTIADAVTIDTSQNVGIGTSSPAGKLNISNGGANGLEIDPSQNSGATTLLQSYNRSGSAYTLMRMNSSSYEFQIADSTKMTITNGGDVGIGTTSPTQHNSGRVLHIHNPSGNSAELHLTDNGSGSASGDGSVIHHNSTNLYIQNHEAGNLQFYNNGGERMRITSAGDVLMGNTVVNPASGFASQKGFGYDFGTGQTQIATTDNASTLVLGRNNATDGSIIDLRKESTVIGTFGSNTTGGQPLLDISANGTNGNMRFLTAGSERLRIKSSGSIYSVNSIQGTYFGQDAGNPANVTGAGNTSIGYASGQALTSGYQNTSIGRSANEKLTTGYNNVSVGTNAGYNNVDGLQNTYIGTASGYTSPGQNYNTFVGYEVGHLNQANQNTAVGRLALTANTSGTNNVAVGHIAGDSVTTGSNNTSLGQAAGDEATTGDYNICIGHGSGSGSSPFQLTTESGRVIIGDNSITNSYIKVDWTVTSDKRDKTDFKEIEHGLDFVNKLKPTEYKFRKNRDTEETDGKRRYGFIAQEILELEGEDSVIIDTEQEDDLKYKQSHLVPVLVKAIQELKAEVEILKQKCK
jgi:hypothetical protein